LRQRRRGYGKPVIDDRLFYGGSNLDVVLFNSPLATVIGVGSLSVNPNERGEVIDQNDFAVLTPSQPAPDFATSDELFDNGDLTGD